MLQNRFADVYNFQSLAVYLTMPPKRKQHHVPIPISKKRKLAGMHQLQEMQLRMQEMQQEQSRMQVHMQELLKAQQNPSP